MFRQNPRVLPEIFRGMPLSCEFVTDSEAPVCVYWKCMKKYLPMRKQGQNRLKEGPP